MFQCKISIYCFLIIMLISTPCLGQKEQDIWGSYAAIDKLISTLNIDDDKYDDTIDELRYLLEYPIDLNNTSVEELTRLLILTPQQIKGITNYKKYNGDFYSVYELLCIPQLDKVTIDLIEPFIVANYNNDNLYNWSLSDSFKWNRQLFMSRMDYPIYTRRGYKSVYRGNKLYFNLRYNYQSSKHLFWGFGAEKDRGEALFGPYSKWGFDYYTYYLLLKNYKFINYFALGKFRLQWGLGLVLGVGQFGSRFNQLNQLFQVNNKIYKHSSFDEYNYLNGVATSLHWNHIDATFFYSYRRFDGDIDNGIIKKRSRTGLHRTDAEIERKNRIRNNLYGFKLDYKRLNYYLSMNLIYYNYNGKYRPNGRSYAKYEARGDSFYNISLDYGLLLNNIILKGEIAKSNKGIASLNKLYYAPNSEHELLLIHRYYAKNYWANYARSFCSKSTINNEHGWYLSYLTTVLSPIKLNFYVDYYSSMWWRYRVSKPASFLDTGIEISYANSSHFISLSHRYQIKQRDKAKSKGKIINKLFFHKLKLDYIYSKDNWLEIKTMLGYNFKYEEFKEHGYHLTERITLKSKKGNLKANFQATYFNTVSYDTRGYVYEIPLLYSFSSYSLSGNGCRGSLKIDYNLSNLICLTTKVGITTYFDRDKIGNYHREIAKNYKLDCQFQLKFNF